MSTRLLRAELARLHERTVGECNPFAAPLCWPELEARAQEMAAGFLAIGPDEARWHIADMTAAGWDPSVVRRAEYLAGLADD